MTTAPTQTREEPIITLTGLRQRRHLKHLLATRDRLAVMATERHSHRLDDASETFALTIDVEDEIRDLFPDVYIALFPRWITTIAKASHEPGDHNPNCGICIGAAAQPPHPRTA